MDSRNLVNDEKKKSEEADEEKMELSVVQFTNSEEIEEQELEEIQIYGDAEGDEASKTTTQDQTKNVEEQCKSYLSEIKANGINIAIKRLQKQNQQLSDILEQKKNQIGKICISKNVTESLKNKNKTDSGQKGIGSGIVIKYNSQAKLGLFLTCYHTVKNQKRENLILVFGAYELKNPGTEVYKITDIIYDKKDIHKNILKENNIKQTDLCLLEFSAEKWEENRWTQYQKNPTITSSSNLLLLAYGSGSHLKCSLAGSSTDEDTVIAEHKSTGGSSGGVYFNDHGEIVAIHQGIYSIEADKCLKLGIIPCEQTNMQVYWDESVSKNVSDDYLKKNGITEVKVKEDNSHYSLRWMTVKWKQSKKYYAARFFLGNPHQNKEYCKNKKNYCETFYEICATKVLKQYIKKDSSFKEPIPLGIYSDQGEEFKAILEVKDQNKNQPSNAETTETKVVKKKLTDKEERSNKFKNKHEPEEEEKYESEERKQEPEEQNQEPEEGKK